MVEGTYSNEFGDTVDTTPYEWLEVIAEAPRGADGTDAGGTDAEAGEEGGYVSCRVDVTGFSSVTIYAANARTCDAGDGGEGGTGGGSADGAGGDGGGASAIQAGDGTWLLGAGGGGGGAGDGDEDFGGDGHGGGGGAWGGAGGTGDNNGTAGASGPTINGGDGGDYSGGSPDYNATEGQGWANTTYCSNVTTTTGGSSFLFEQSEIQITDSSVDLNGPSSLAVDTKTNTSIDLSWVDNDDNEDGFYVYRSQSSNVSLTAGNRVATLAANTTTYSDTGLTEGTEYHYVVTSYINDEESTPSNEVSTITDLPAPSNLSVDAIDHDSADLSWTVNSTDEGGIRAYRRLAGGAWSEVADLAAGTTAYTDTGLLNGRDYEWHVEAYTTDTTSQSSTVADSTPLPDVDSLPLDTTVEDEITANPSTTPDLNHGQYRIEWKDSEVSTWTEWGTLAYNYASGATITGLADGEKYDVRARSETADTTGAWMTASEITLLPKPGAPSYPTVGQTSVDISWTDNADNEDSQQIWRLRDESGNYSWQLIATVDANVESYTDTTVVPGATYQYYVRALTQYTNASSDTTSTTTTASGHPKTPTRRSRWTVEVVAPTGEVLRPQVTESPAWLPETNAMPRVRIPVADRPRWQRQDLLESPQTEVRVWYEGKQLPIDDLVAVDSEPGQAVLECRGASQLDTFVAAEQIDEQETHLALRDLIQTYTDYATDIDDPDADTRSDVEMLSGSGGRPDEFRDALSPAPDGDNPHFVDTNGLQTEQVAWFTEAEDALYQGTETIFDDTALMSGNRAIRLEEGDTNGTGDYSAVRFEPDYDVPVADLQIAWRYSFPSTGDSPAYEVIFGEQNDEDTQVVETTTSEGALLEVSHADAKFRTTPISGSGLPNDYLEAGVTYRFEVRLTSTTGESLYVDCHYPYDSATDVTPGGAIEDGVIQGCPLHPNAYPVETVDVSSVAQVIGGELTIQTNSTANGQALAISNDQGASWIETANTTSVSGSFASAEQQIRGEFTLSHRTADPNTSPGVGDAPQIVESFELLANLDDTPVLLDKSYDGDLVDILDAAAESGDFVLEPRRDPTAAWDDPTGIIVEGTVAGQRSRSRIQEDAIDYSATRTVEDSYDKIVVQGKSAAIEGEQFSASQYDALVGLNEGPIVTASERVYDPSDGTVFERGTDYRIVWTDPFDQNDEEGAIELLSSGSMSTGTTYEIDYRYKFQGSASTPGVSDPRTRKTPAVDAASDRECEQIALAILKRVQDPLEEATVTVQTEDPTVSLIDALSHPELPLEGPLVIRDASFEPGRVEYVLGTRQSFADVFEQIESQYRALAENT